MGGRARPPPPGLPGPAEDAQRTERSTVSWEENG
nr:MAG TPA: hypothetical protein [Caudoviricetes sp.]